MPLDVATAADFSRDVLGQIVAPVLQRVEGDDLDGIAELTGQEVGNDGFDVGTLGFSSDAMRLCAFHDQIDRLVGAIWHIFEEIRAWSDLRVAADIITMRSKGSRTALTF